MGLSELACSIYVEQNKKQNAELVKVFETLEQCYLYFLWSRHDYSNLYIDLNFYTCDCTLETYGDH